jgi:hypothetical protein
MPVDSGRYPSGQRGQTVNLLANAFGGSNPPLPTIMSFGRPGPGVGGLSQGASTMITPGPGVGGLSQGASTMITPGPGVGGPMSAGPGSVVQRRFIEFRGNSSAVERQPSKLGVAGSNPVSRSRIARSDSRFAHVAQSAERVLGKDEVSGSIPDMGSILTDGPLRTANGR